MYVKCETKKLQLTAQFQPSHTVAFSIFGRSVWCLVFELGGQWSCTGMRHAPSPRVIAGGTRCTGVSRRYMSIDTRYTGALGTFSLILRLLLNAISVSPEPQRVKSGNKGPNPGNIGENAIQSTGNTGRPYLSHWFVGTPTMLCRINSSWSLVASAVLLFYVSGAYGHGYVREVILGATSWPGYNPFVDSYVLRVSDLQTATNAVILDGGSHPRSALSVRFLALVRTLLLQVPSPHHLSISPHRGSDTHRVCSKYLPGLRT